MNCLLLECWSVLNVTVECFVTQAVYSKSGVMYKVIILYTVVRLGPLHKDGRDARDS